jgi:curved DNA-binding protein
MPAPDDIKKAFRKLARQYHPDTAKDKKTAEEKFKEINEANEVLGDPEKRKKYDTLGANWQEPEAARPRAGRSTSAAPASATSSSSTSAVAAATASRRALTKAFPPAGRQGRARRGHDIEGDILVTLEEAMHGTQRPISLQTVNRQTGAVQTHSFEVRIPPGATDGRRIRVPGQGEPGRNGGEAGDLYLRVRHASHPDFTTREADLHHELDVAPWEAVLGAEVIVPTLDGSIKLRIPAGTEDHQQLRVRGAACRRARPASAAISSSPSTSCCPPRSAMTNASSGSSSAAPPPSTSRLT